MKLKQIKLQNYRMHKDLTIDVPAEGLEIVKPNYWGKEQPHYSKILTPDGFTTMGEIQVGDDVISEDGKSYKVTGKFPQGKKDIYRLTFRDGSKADCGLEHLWDIYVKNRYQGKKHVYGKVTMATKEMLQEGIKKDRSFRFRTKTCEPVQFNSKGQLTLPPYTVGVLIGDGCLCLAKSTTMGHIYFSNMEDDIINRLNYELKDLGKFEKNEATQCQYRWQDNRSNEKGMSYLRNSIIWLGLNVKSGEKFIPEEYKYASVQDRLDLIAGILDTDGHFSNQQSPQIHTSSKQLAEDLKFILKSLGVNCNVWCHDRRDTGRKSLEYIVNISVSDKIKPNSQKHKKSKLNQVCYYEKQSEYNAIVNIEKLDFQEECSCIMVDSPNHTYITDDFLITHNTTISNSILDCLTGKPLTGEKNYSSKPIIDGEEVHGVDSSVTLVFDNGTTLKKTLQENWEKKRGSIDKTFTGNSYTYEVNGVPSLKKEFDSFINNNIATQEQIQSLFNPQWWCENKPDGYGWEKRREILLEMLGNVNESQLLTDELVAVLNSNTPEDAKKVYKSAMKNINKQIDDVPTSIEENQLKINSIEKIDIAEFTAQIQDLENEKAAAHKRIAEMSSEGEQERSLRTAYLNAQEQLSTARVNYNIEYQKRVEQANKPIREQENLLTQLDDDIIRVERQLNTDSSMLELNLKQLLSKREKLLAEYTDVKSKVFVPGSLFCPTCNQPMPQEQIDKAMAKFNQDKSNELLYIQAEGQQTNEAIKKAEIILVGKQEQQKQLQEKLNELKAKRLAEVEKLNTLIANKPVELSFEETEEHQRLAQAVTEAQQATLNVPNKELAIQPYKQLIQAKTEEQQALQTKIANFKSIEQHKARIKELTEESQRLSKEYAQAEKAVYLIEQYQIARIKLLDDSVNEKFKTLRFRMFKPNIGNDGIQDCCDVLINSKNSGLVAYQSASTSEKIIANFELIEALSDYWGIELPIIVDNAEAIQKENRPRLLDKQVIWLAVEQK